MFENFAFTSYCVDKNIWNELKQSLKNYNKILIVTGNKSFDSIKEKLLEVLKGKKYEVKNIRENVLMNMLTIF